MKHLFFLSESLVVLLSLSSIKKLFPWKNDSKFTCECIDDNTKDNIHENNVDNQETGHIIGKPYEKPSLIITFVTLPQQNITNSTRGPRTLYLPSEKNNYL
jgi:hypothetical protein